MFVTTSAYTNAATQYAREMDIILIDGIQLIKMAKIDKEEPVRDDEWQMRVEDFKRYIPKDLYKEYFN